MIRRVQSKCFGVLAAAAMIWGAAMSQAQATTLDKLIGKTLTVGNLVFSNFAAPSFVGAGPSGIDVQGIVVTDPDTGKQQAGLRFVAPFSESPKGGPHEIVLNVQYIVTDSAGQLNTIAQSMITTITGQAGVMLVTTASPSAAVAFGSLSDPTLTYVQSCNWFGALCLDQSSSPSATSFAIVSSGNPSVSAPLFPGTSTFYVQHQVQLQIANRKGVTGGTATLQEFNALFSE